MFEELASLLFHSRDYGHRAHLASRSHAKHIALDEFYKTLVDLIDRIVETYQGRYGFVSIPYLDAQDDATEPEEVLLAHLKILENVRYRVSDKNDTPLQSQLDDVVNLYLSTLYKLHMGK